MSIKNVAFFAILAAGVVPALIILATFPLVESGEVPELGTQALLLIGQFAPAVAADATAVGLATPFAAVGALAVLVPSPAQQRAYFAAIGAAALGWAIHLWLATSLGENGFRKDVVFIFESIYDPQDSKAKFETLETYASTMRAVFLALGAALVGIKIRVGSQPPPGAPPPSPPQSPAGPTPGPSPQPPGPNAPPSGAPGNGPGSPGLQDNRAERRGALDRGRFRPGFARAPLALSVALAIAAPAHAGAVRVDARGADFDATVEVKIDPSGGPTPLSQIAGGVAEFAFGEDLFATSAYVERILVITWTPKTPDRPVDDVAAFSVELPVVLRKWRAADQYFIRASPMRGFWKANLDEMEALRSGDSWTKTLASLQQDDHLNRIGKGGAAAAHRALNTAVAGLNAIVRSAPVAWVRPPLGLRDRADKSFGGEKPDKFRVVVGGLTEIEKAIWSDIWAIDRRLKSESCEVVAGTFDYLDERKAQNPVAYDLALGATPTLLADKRASAEKACAGLK